MYRGSSSYSDWCNTLLSARHTGLAWRLPLRVDLFKIINGEAWTQLCVDHLSSGDGAQIVMINFGAHLYNFARWTHMLHLLSVVCLSVWIGPKVVDNNSYPSKLQTTLLKKIMSLLVSQVGLIANVKFFLNSSVNNYRPQSWEIIYLVAPGRLSFMSLFELSCVK